MVEKERKLCPICNKIKTEVYKGGCRTCRNKSKPNNSPLIKCQCSEECQEMIHSLDIRGRPVIRKKGHQMKGNKHYSYKGIKQVGDYIRVKAPKGHPYTDGVGYIAQHRLILEQYYSKIMNNPIYLDPKIYDVHHINGIKTDNRIKNLTHLQHHYHARISNLGNYNSVEDMSKRVCILCGARMDTNSLWHHYDDGWICNSCYNKIYKPKYYERFAKEIILCACGCGESIPKYTKTGRLAKYKHGHNRRINSNNTRIN